MQQAAALRVLTAEYPMHRVDCEAAVAQQTCLLSGALRLSSKAQQAAVAALSVWIQGSLESPGGTRWSGPSCASHTVAHIQPPPAACASTSRHVGCCQSRHQDMLHLNGRTQVPAAVQRSVASEQMLWNDPSQGHAGDLQAVLGLQRPVGCLCHTQGSCVSVEAHPVALQKVVFTLIHDGG